MQIEFHCSLCKLYILLPLGQFEKESDGGLGLTNLKCINCQTVLITNDLVYECEKCK